MTTGYAADPGAAVEAAFCAIQRERMADVPILNPALHVEAIGFARWQGRWLGVLVTPWCMNLMLLPEAPARWTRIAAHERVFYRFPAGDLAFLCGHEPGLGEYHSCALYSPMAQFIDQDSARAVGRAALAALMRAAPGAEFSDLGAPSAPGAAGAAVLAPLPTMTKRAFLGRLLPRVPT